MLVAGLTHPSPMTNSVRTAGVCFAFILMCQSPIGTVQADSGADESLPLWEIGIAGIGAHVPDYPGASHSQRTGIVLPTAVYRGDLFLLSSDSDGVNGAFALTDRLFLNVGVDASFSADSDDNPQRRGMPDLDYLVEAGPSLEYRLWQDDASVFTAAAQVRAAYAVNTDRFEYSGFAVEPQLVFERAGLWVPQLQWRLGLSAKFGYDGLNAYFFEVPAEFATTERPAYRARDGYQQVALSTRLSAPLTDRLGIFVLSQLLYGDGSVNEDSPLYRDDLTYAIGLGFSYTLFVSDRRVGDDSN